MFDPVVFGVSDYEESKAFFLRALEPIGIEVLAEGPLGIELSADGRASRCIRREGERSGPVHLAFTAENRDQVEAFHRAPLAASPRRREAGASGAADIGGGA